jgi:hypothetical protein
MTGSRDEGIDALLAATRVRIDPRLFVILDVPATHAATLRGMLAQMYAPFFIQMFPDEQTIVVPEDEWGRLRATIPGAREETGYRLVTLDVVLDWDVTGYLAAVTAALAAAGVPVGVLSSFHHDHLLVQRAHLERAVAALQALTGGRAGARDGR